MADSVYTAVATSTGDARAGGHVVSDDGVLDLTLTVPTAMGGPGGASNPEQMFAAGWAACFHSAVKAVAATQKVRVNDSAVVAEVGLGPLEGGGYGLSAALHVELSGVDQATADQLVEGAHALCPYSNATRGNIPVTIDATVV